jgi:3-oxoacyl-[acyl-carrier-protein] synthase-3
MPPDSPTATWAPAAARAATPRTNAATIVGVGAHEPEAVLSNADLEQMVDTSNAWILERTGIRERRRAGSGETCSVMAASAARVALARAGTPQIDLIMVATVSPDTLFPSASCLVQRRLEMPGVPALDINGACSGFMYGLTLADSLIAAGRARHILLIASEAMTSLVDYSDRSTCVLFGDGAGAVVVGAADAGGVVATRWGADGRDADLIYYGPDGTGERTDNAIRMHGKGTFKQAVERLAELARMLCADAGWRLDEVDHVIPHQANMRIVEAAAKRIGVPMERVVVNGDRLGNTSAASIPLAMAEADATGRLRSGDKILCLAFGAGSTWGGVALEWTLPQNRL